MSLLKVNNIESLNGPTGTINMTGNLVVNGMPISGSTGPTGAAGPTGPASVGGIGGATVVYVSADSDPITNGVSLQAAYNTAGLLPASTNVLSTVSLPFDGMSTSMYLSIPYGSVLQSQLAQTYYAAGGMNPVEITINSTQAWFRWDGMSITMSRTYDMMTPVEMGTWNVAFTDVVYTQNTLIIGPGYYETPDTFIIDKDTVNITSVSGNPDVFIYNLAPGISGTTAPNSGVHVSANAIKVTGISTDFRVQSDNSFPGMYSTVNTSSPFTIGSNLNWLILENCVGGDSSFGHQAGDTTGYNNTTFINCLGGQYSFGRDGDTIAGTYINCTGLNYSWGYGGCTVNGTFTNCVGGYYSFGGFGATTVGGLFYNCRVTSTGGFSPNGGTLSGTFINCTAQEYGFGDQATTTGVFYNCVAGNYSWKGQQSGKYYNCVASVDSWSNIAAGKLYHCVISYDNSSAFPTVTSGGRTYYCIDGFGNTNNQ